MGLRLRHASLRTRIIAWSFVPTAIIMLAVAVTIYYAYQRVTEELVVGRNQDVTRLSASQLSSDLTSSGDILASLARTADLSSDNPPRQAAALKQASNRLVVFDAGVVVLDERGRVAAAEPERPDIIGQDWSGHSYFRQMVRATGPVFSDIVADGPQGEQVIAMAVPVSSDQGFRGTVVGMFRLGAASFSAFYGGVLRLRIADNGSTYLVDSTGRVIFHPDAGRIGSDAHAQAAVQSVLRRQAGALRTNDLEGRAILASFAPVPGTPWGLINEQDWAGLLASGQGYGQFLVVLLILGVVVPALVVTVGVRRITRPIEKLTAAAQEVAGGNLGQQIDVQTGDELEELVKQFNLMSARLAESYAALWEREERFVLVIDGTNDGIWDWDLKTNAVYFSPRWKSMLGYEDHEIANRFDEWLRLMHPDDVERAQAEVQAYLEGRTPVYQLEHRLRHKDGTYRWILARAVATRDPDGTPSRMAGSHTDMTERRQAEEALRASEAEMRALLAAMTDVILVLDAEGRYLKVAPTNPSLLYKPSDEMVGKTLHDLFPPAQAASFHATLRRALETGRPVDFEYSLPIGGREVWFAATISPMPGNTAIWVARDITRRKQDECALEERLSFEKLVTNISTEFINLGPDEIDAGIQHALQAIGEFTGDDRSYVFQFSSDGTTMDNTHEWCRAGITPQIHNLQAQPAEALSWSMAKIKRLETVHVPRVLDLPPEAQVDREQMRGQDIRSIILVPIVYRGAAVGFVGFDSVRREREWTEDTVTLLRIVGEIFANALEHKRAREALRVAYQTLERRVKERTHELQALNAVAGLVSRSLDLKEILSDALDKTLEVTGMDGGAAYRLEGGPDATPDQLVLKPLLHRGMSDEFIRLIGPLPYRGSAVAVAAESGQPLIWEVATAKVGPEKAKRALRKEGIEMLVTVPLMAKGKLVGAFHLGARGVRPFAPEEMSLLAAIGQQVGVAMENARLYEQAEESAAIAERNRLAHELHDSVTQSLYSVTLYAEAAARLLSTGKHLEAADHLRELRDTAQEALREMRLLIFELHPPALEKSGLAGALQIRLDAVEGRGGMQTDLQIEGAEKLPPSVQAELYHIALEALNNVLKHAKARHVCVAIRFLDTATAIEIEDDGIGFEPSVAQGRGGLGLEGMRERAQRIGAKLQIQSAPGRGTKVTVEAPLAPAKDDANA